MTRYNFEADSQVMRSLQFATDPERLAEHVYQKHAIPLFPHAEKHSRNPDAKYDYIMDALHTKFGSSKHWEKIEQHVGEKVLAGLT